MQLIYVFTGYLYTDSIRALITNRKKRKRTHRMFKIGFSFHTWLSVWKQVPRKLKIKIKSNYNFYVYYRPQTKFAKVMFLQVSVCPQGGMHGRGTCMAGGHAWQGACMTGGMCGTGACMAGERGVHGGGVCMAGGHAWWGCAWQGGHTWWGACMADTTRYSQWAGGTHPTGMHSCIYI